MKRIVSLFLCLLMVMSLVSVAAAEERVTLTMMNRLPASYVVEENPVIEALEDLLNVNLEIEAPPISSYSDRRNIVLASGDLPDIIYVNDTGASYSQWSRDGLFLDLTPYLNETDMPNAYKVLTEQELSKVIVDDAVYSLPRVQTKPMDIIMYRQDWLDKLGLEVPTTPAEFAEVAKAFTTQDPDGNGVNDTYGWTFNTDLGEAARHIISGFGVRPSDVPDENGNYELMEASDEYIAYLDWMRDMYAAGAINPEFYLITANADDELWYAGKMGIRYVNANVEHYVSDMGSTNWAINAETENVEAAVKFLDACYTDAVNNIMAFGVEGITYTTFNDEQQYALKTPEQRQNFDKYCATYATFNYQTEDKGLLIVNGDTIEETELFAQANNNVAAQTERISYLQGSALPGVSEVSTAIADEGLRDTFKELRTKYVCGQIEREELVDFLKNTFAPAYQPMLDIYAEHNLNK